MEESAMEHTMDKNFESSGLVGDDFKRELVNIEKNWSWFLVLGIGLIVVGTLAMSWAVTATIASVVVCGSFVTAGGVMNIVSAFAARKWRGFSMHFFLGVLYTFVGLYMMMSPINAAETVTLFLAFALIFGGFLRMIFAISERFQGWGWVLLNGFVALLLGASIAAHWPISGAWIIGFFVGVDLILNGASWMARAFVLRRLAH